MNAATEAKFKPFQSPASRDISAAKVNSPNDEPAVEAGAGPKSSFKDLLLNSNDQVVRERAAQKNGDQLRMAKTDEDFAKLMAAKANQGMERKPQNEMDKNAFLKLFVTQMRNQDPMNPDKSSDMAAQLAQFHGLEQMMNVNKNLEKMQNDEALGRAVTLINFVGKEIKLDNGKLMIEGGKVATDATFKLEHEAAKATMEIRDGAGVIVATQELGHQHEGEHPLEWSGVNKDGHPLVDGAYTFNIQATDLQGQPMTASITSNIPVTGVDLHEGGGSFYTPIGKVGVREVSAVGSQGYSKTKTPILGAPGVDGMGMANLGVDGAGVPLAGEAGAPMPRQPTLAGAGAIAGAGAALAGAASGVGPAPGVGGASAAPSGTAVPGAGAAHAAGAASGAGAGSGADAVPGAGAAPGAGAVARTGAAAGNAGAASAANHNAKSASGGVDRSPNAGGPTDPRAALQAAMTDGAAQQRVQQSHAQPAAASSTPTDAGDSKITVTKQTPPPMGSDKPSSPAGRADKLAGTRVSR